jgi:hypothetical protein
MRASPKLRPLNALRPCSRKRVAARCRVSRLAALDVLSRLLGAKTAHDIQALRQAWLHVEREKEKENLEWKSRASSAFKNALSVMKRRWITIIIPCGSAPMP